MKRILAVLIWMKSWCECLRPPWGGPFAIGPSMIFRSACWAPSWETSHEVEGLSRLLSMLLFLGSYRGWLIGNLQELLW